MQFLHLRYKHHRKLFIRIILLSIELQILKLSVIASLRRLKTLVLPVEVSIAASTCLALVRILESFCVNSIHDSIHLKHCLKFTDCLGLGGYPLVLKVLSLCGCWICPVVAGCDVVLHPWDSWGCLLRGVFLTLMMMLSADIDFSRGEMLVLATELATNLFLVERLRVKL